MDYISKISLPNGNTYAVRDANVSNPDYLVNSNFKINQRGKSSYTVTGYTVDMWRSQIFFTVSALSNGIEISCAKSITANYIALVQEVPVSDSMIGNDFILSLNLSSTNDYAYAAIYVYSDSNTLVRSSAKVKIGVGMNYIPVSGIPDTAAYIRVQITINAGAEIGDSIIINWAKLEMGKIATPYCRPDPALELIKCQRYYQTRTTGDIPAADMRPSMATIKDIKQREDGLYEYIAE